MQHSEKNAQQKEQVKELLYQRHFNEHKYWHTALINQYPGYVITPQEQAGIASRVAILKSDIHFGQVVHRLRLIMQLINSYMAKESNEQTRYQLNDYLSDLQEVISFFDWLNSFGPLEQEQ